MILVTREAPGEIQLKVCDWDLTEHPTKVPIGWWWKNNFISNFCDQN